MTITANGWSNKSGTASRSCSCGTWKRHWLNFSGKSWPAQCSVGGCSTSPTLGGHIINRNVQGERIAPMCDSCNSRSGSFDLKGGVDLPSANTAETCG